MATDAQNPMQVPSGKTEEPKPKKVGRDQIKDLMAYIIGLDFKLKNVYSNEVEFNNVRTDYMQEGKACPGYEIRVELKGLEFKNTFDYNGTQIHITEIDKSELPALTADQIFDSIDFSMPMKPYIQGYLKLEGIPGFSQSDPAVPTIGGFYSTMRGVTGESIFEAAKFYVGGIVQDIWRRQINM